MPQPVLDMELRPAGASDLAAPAPAVTMFERLALDPNVSVDKLERLIQMQERIMAHNAKAAFGAAFTAMQSELPEISEKGQILVKGVLRSTYAKLEDIHAAIKPVLQKHGFAIRHRTEWPAERPNVIRIVGILSHEQGHSEESAFEAPMDKSEYRTDIQSMGSTVSYGRRYTTLDLLNITTRGQDKDGAGKEPESPKGFDNWLADMEATADTGLSALQVAFQKSPKEFREFVTKHQAIVWARLKTRAGAVKVPK